MNGVVISDAHVNSIKKSLSTYSKFYTEMFEISHNVNKSIMMKETCLDFLAP